ncbi:MAG: tRNA lysidine(34) synthetase TilS [Candidatus Sphingomonas phytovorans]|nr:tRNA lysidine(34) synthetase TilS [Sphingomonas sp.]WEJ98631.1 MAG: tRNA lysidine(34) synthetase TilS [Sphingomonas sp.]
MSAPDTASVERFRQDFEAVLGRAPASNERIALAVSGGPDSMALLALAAAAFPGQAIAATVDHGLRAESADEAAMVAGYCAGAAIPHETLRIPAPPEAGDNIQSWARQERYALLRRWAVDSGALALATAHHADDQAETFLMRAARGAGLSGLAAVRARQEMEVPTHGPRARVLLLRPLLGWRHNDLVALAAAAGLPFVDDPSNDDDRFDRTRFRRLLAGAPWIDPVQIGRSATWLADVDADLVAISQWLWQERALPSDEFEATLDVSGLPRAVRRYLARMAIEHVLEMKGGKRGNWSRATNIESLLDALDSGKAGTQAGVMASPKGDLWHFREAPPRRSH